MRMWLVITCAKHGEKRGASTAALCTTPCELQNGLLRHAQHSMHGQGVSRTLGNRLEHKIHLYENNVVVYLHVERVRLCNRILPAG